MSIVFFIKKAFGLLTPEEEATYLLNREQDPRYVPDSKDSAIKCTIEYKVLKLERVLPF